MEQTNILNNFTEILDIIEYIYKRIPQNKSYYTIKNIFERISKILYNIYICFLNHIKNFINFLILP